MRVCELKQKEIINVCTCKSLGCPIDVEFDCKTSPSLGVSTIIFWSLFRFGTATASINAGFFRFSKT